MSATYMNRIIGGRNATDGAVVTDSDDKPGYLEVCASPEEFDSLTIMEGFVGGDYMNIGLNPAAVRELIGALQNALDIHGQQHA